MQEFIYAGLPECVKRSVAAEAKLATQQAAAFVSTNAAVALVNQKIYTNAAAAGFSEFACGGTRPALVHPEGTHVPAALVAENVGAAGRIIGEWENRLAVEIGS